jgi:hypothetical protein
MELEMEEQARIGGGILGEKGRDRVDREIHIGRNGRQLSLQSKQFY